MIISSKQYKYIIAFIIITIMLVSVVSPGFYSGNTQNSSSKDGLLSQSSSRYNVTFTETGLPSGTTWYVNLTNGNSYNTTSSTIAFNETNGTYNYTISTVNKIYRPDSYAGAFTINGSNVSQAIAFKEVTYKATFTETGLPSGTTWYVNLTNGNSYNTTSSTIAFNETNGTYKYTVSTDNTAYSPSYKSTFTVNGAPVSESITFSKVTYKATFTETGLPTATTWYVNLTNGMSSGAIIGASYNLYLTNGTYTYTVSTDNTIYSPSYNNAFTVDGKSISKAIAFKEVTYKATFTETGLPSGTTWYVNLTNGNSYNTTINAL